MKECPECLRCFDDAVEICSYDDAPLQAAFAGPAILDGKYRVDQRLGHGGMGVVYRVHHRALQKTFALKVIATFDDAFLARFRTEAETLGRLKHPNIVEVTDFGIDAREGGIPYLVMEYLEGSTLADLNRRLGRLPIERSLPIFESIAEAIDHAHERGILHLDLKPGNVFVSTNESRREAVKILDFGLARFVGDPSAPGEHGAGRDERVAHQTTSPSEPVDGPEPSERGGAIGGGGTECAERPASHSHEDRTPEPEAGALDHQVGEGAEQRRCPVCGGKRAITSTLDGACPACLLRLGLSAESLLGIEDGLLASAPLDDAGFSRSFRPLSEQRCFGTPAYMAPEVLSGKQATRASDIYSFGILMYEILVGRHPFQGSPLEVIAGHCSGAPPPPATLNSALPPELDQALLPALAKNPADRPPRATGLVQQIRSAVFRAHIRTWRERETPRRIGLAVAAAIVLPLVLTPVWRSGVLQQLENRSVDARFLAAPTRAPDARLMMISLDESSLAADPTPLTEKADEFGRELERVFAAGARAIAIDFLLPETWSRSKAFSDLILRHPEALTLGAFSSPGGIVIGPECLNALAAAALGPKRVSDLFAFVNLNEDSDGVSRRAHLSYLDQNGTQRDAWAIRAVRNLDAALVPKTSSAVWIDHSVDWQRIERVSWKDLATTLEQQPDLFQDRLVLVGGDFVGFGGDYHRVPFRSDGAQGVSGLVLQALIANTILSGAPVREVAPFTFLLGIGLVVMTLMLAFLLSIGWQRPALVVLTSVPVYVGASFLLFLQMHVLLPLVGPMMTAAVAVALAFVLRTALPRFPEVETDGL
jgi:serine/threonine protein kinase/CHASE2 domain-containing sensor protein